jgi:hypothetical protein
MAHSCTKLNEWFLSFSYASFGGCEFENLTIENFQIIAA